MDQLEDWDVYYVQSTDDLPLCGSDTMGRLYYISDVSGFQVCTNLGWAFIDLTGPAGAPGVNGTNGVNGLDGMNGLNGTNNGLNGTNGEWPQWDERCERDRRIHGAGFDDSDSIQCIHLRDLEWWDPGRSRSRSRPEWDARCLRGATNLLHLQRPPGGERHRWCSRGAWGERDGWSRWTRWHEWIRWDGWRRRSHSHGHDLPDREWNAACPNGGIQVQVGLDDNSSGILDPVEVDQTTYICNGAPGVNGTDGAPGVPGMNERTVRMEHRGPKGLQAPMGAKVLEVSMEPMEPTDGPQGPKASPDRTEPMGRWSARIDRDRRPHPSIKRAMSPAVARPIRAS